MMLIIKEFARNIKIMNIKVINIKVITQIMFRSFKELKMTFLITLDYIIKAIDIIIIMGNVIFANYIIMLAKRYLWLLEFYENV